MSEEECFGFPVSKLCIESYKCKDKDCKNLHPRCLFGICIQSIKDECQGCKKFHHHWDDKMEIQQHIHGLYYWNLCYEQGQCSCELAHREWLQNICIECISKRRCSHSKNHKKWLDLYKQINEEGKYKYKNTTFENIKNQPFPSKICLNYIQGKCGKIYGCEKEHISWEDLCLSQKKNKKVQPCSPDQQKKIDEFLQKNKFFRPLSLLFTQSLKKQITKQTLEEQNVMDFLIIMDCTGSMDTWMNLTQQNLCQVIDRTRVQTNLKIRIGYVGYRDICDKEKNYAIKDFTENAEEIKQFIKQQEADGGGDLAEDLIGALQKGLELSFSESPGSILCTLLICDAPCHGKQYYEGESFDDQEYNIAEGTLENLMIKYKNLKKKSFFYVFKINEEYTDKMVGIMEQNFPLLQYIAIDNKSKEFYQILYKTLLDSVTQAENFQEDKEVLKVKAKYKKIIFPKLPEFIDCDYWQNYSEKLQNCFDEGKSYLEIQKKHEILTEDQKGVTSEIFRLRDKEWNLNLICKISKEQIKKYEEYKNCTNEDEKIKIKEKINQIAKESSENRFYTVAYSHQLSRQFRNFQKTNKPDYPIFIFYVCPIIYELDVPFYGANIIYAENYIEMNSNEVLQLKGSFSYTQNQQEFQSTSKTDQLSLQGFQKYTNNLNSQQLHMFTAFSHYTNIVTNGELLVCDLQGYLNILTDPVIHTKDESKFKQLNSSLNQHDVGITAFFENQHQKCNLLCQSFLKLKEQSTDLRNSQILTEMEESKNQQKQNLRTTRMVQDNQTQYIVCFICHRQERQDTNYIMSNLIDGNVPCQKCKQLLNQKVTALCLCCQEEFEYCEFETISLRKKIPQCCEQCLEKCFVNELNFCHYCKSRCTLNSDIKEIQKKNYRFCQQSLYYLEGLRCKKCQCSYSFARLLTDDEYFKNEFVCQKCSN